MLNRHFHRRCTSGLIILILLCSLTGCTSEPSLSNATIWKGYVIVVSQDSIADPDLAEAIAEAQTNYRIWRLGSGSVITPSNTHRSSFCLPVELQGQSTSQSGVRFSIRMVSRQDAESMIPLTFIRWDGIDAWFVTAVDNPAECYRLE
jgi:hypothetical protein